MACHSLVSEESLLLALSTKCRHYKREGRLCLSLTLSYEEDLLKNSSGLCTCGVSHMQSNGRSEQVGGCHMWNHIPTTGTNRGSTSPVPGM